MMKHVIWLALMFLVGCDVIKERAGIPDPAKIEAEGKALGSACRHAGWGPEDCYRINPDASKPAMFAGWKEMNEYMIKNNMEILPPTVPPGGLQAEPTWKKPKKKMIDLESPQDAALEGDDPAKSAKDAEGDAKPKAGSSPKADSKANSKTDPKADSKADPKSKSEASE